MMKTKLLTILPAAAVAACLGFAGHVAQAQVPASQAPALIGQPPSAYQTIGAYYSPALKAQFRIEQFFLPAYGTFVAARMVSEPDFDSPLRGAGLAAGDVITRLDGVRVTNLGELERHFDSTVVRFIKTGTTFPRDAHIFIDLGGGYPPLAGVNVP